MIKHTPFHPLFLLGFMGAGKTTVGHLLSLRWDVPFVDLDAFIEQQTSTSIHTLFEHGEPSFRELESSALATLATYPGIIALGGGTILSRENRKVVFHHGTTIYLHASLTVLSQRLHSKEQLAKRPLLHSSRKETLEALYQRRFPFYERATTIIQTDEKNSAEVADLIEIMMSPQMHKNG